LFNELTKLFGGKQKERRHSPRKKARFNISWVKNGNELIPGVGMEMSLNGLLMATKTAPGVPDFDIIMEIGGHKIRTRLHTARSGSIIRENQQWTVIGATYSGIAADDYDAVVRFCKDQPMEVHNRAAAELAAMDKSDDAYRMLPMAVQRHVLDALIRLGRLDMPQPNQQPLLRMSSLGSAGGKHRLAVHSRIAASAGMDPQAFDSVIIIDETGNVKVES